MRVVVLGAGAVGCYFGGMLARGGHEVVLVGRGVHVDAVNARGLRIETAAFDEVVPVAASTDPAAAAGADVVLVCVKSSDSHEAANALAPHLPRPDAGPGTDRPEGGPIVLSLQNGLDNADRIAAVLGRPVLPAVVYVATEMAGPGHVRHHGRGELVVETGVAATRLREEFAPAGIPLHLVPDVRVALWAKLAANCGWNALSAVTDRPYGWLAEVDGMPEVVADAVAECRAVAAADGVEVPGSLFEDVASLAHSMAGQRSSTAQDLARRRPSEIDHLNGYVARRGAELGVPTPVNRALLALVKAFERRGGEPSS